MLPRCLLVDDPLFSLHRASEPHPERPERLVAARRAVEIAHTSLAFQNIAARDATREELERVHTADYLERLGHSAGKWTQLDADTFVCPDSVAAATRAAGASVALIDGLLDGQARFGTALLRPPGHHARPDNAMGFCLLNNVAVAAAAARARGTARTLVLDWDVHHGNGTQEMFWAMPDVLYVSLHQFPYYPGSGAAEEIGSSEGRGYTVNVPLSAGADDAVYVAAFERVVLPIVEQYRPELTLISAGFDAHTRDPLGGMLLTDGGFNELTRILLAALPPDRPIALLLEGGYDLQGLEGALLASLRALGGAGDAKQRTTPPNPIHEREILHALNVQRRYWYLG